MSLPPSSSGGDGRLAGEGDFLEPACGLVSQPDSSRGANVAVGFVRRAAAETERVRVCVRRTHVRGRLLLTRRT